MCKVVLYAHMYIFTLYLPWWFGGKESVHAGDLRGTNLILGSGRSPRGGHGNPFQYSCLEDPMDRGIDGLQSLGSQSQTQLRQLSTHSCTRYVFKQLPYRAHAERLNMSTKPQVLLHHFFLGQSCSYALKILTQM